MYRLSSMWSRWAAVVFTLLLLQACTGMNKELASSVAHKQLPTGCNKRLCGQHVIDHESDKIIVPQSQLRGYTSKVRALALQTSADGALRPVVQTRAGKREEIPRHNLPSAYRDIPLAKLGKALQKGLRAHLIPQAGDSYRLEFQPGMKGGMQGGSAAPGNTPQPDTPEAVLKYLDQRQASQPPLGNTTPELVEALNDAQTSIADQKTLCYLFRNYVVWFRDPTNTITEGHLREYVKLASIEAEHKLSAKRKALLYAHFESLLERVTKTSSAAENKFVKALAESLPWLPADIFQGHTQAILELCTKMAGKLAGLEEAHLKAASYEEHKPKFEAFHSALVILKHILKDEKLSRKEGETYGRFKESLNVLLSKLKKLKLMGFATNHIDADVYPYQYQVVRIKQALKRLKEKADNIEKARKVAGRAGHGIAGLWTLGSFLKDWKLDTLKKAFIRLKKAFKINDRIIVKPWYDWLTDLNEQVYLVLKNPNNWQGFKDAFEKLAEISLNETEGHEALHYTLVQQLVHLGSHSQDPTARRACKDYLVQAQTLRKNLKWKYRGDCIPAVIKEGVNILNASTIPTVGNDIHNAVIGPWRRREALLKQIQGLGGDVGEIKKSIQGVQVKVLETLKDELKKLKQSTITRQEFKIIFKKVLEAEEKQKKYRSGVRETLRKFYSKKFNEAPKIQLVSTQPDAKRRVELEKKVELGELFDNGTHTVFLVDQAGADRTKLGYQIARLWAQDDCYKDRFKAVYVLPMSKVVMERYSEKNDQNLETVIACECSDRGALSGEKLRRFKLHIEEQLENHSKDILLVLHGADECNGANNWLIEQVKKRAPGACRLWVHSNRSTAEAALPLISDSQGTRLVENISLSDEHVAQYIQRYFLEDRQEEGKERYAAGHANLAIKVPSKRALARKLAKGFFSSEEEVRQRVRERIQRFIKVPENTYWSNSEMRLLAHALYEEKQIDGLKEFIGVFDESTRGSTAMKENLILLKLGCIDECMGLLENSEALREAYSKELDQLIEEVIKYVRESLSDIRCDPERRSLHNMLLRVLPNLFHVLHGSRVWELYSSAYRDWWSKDIRDAGREAFLSLHTRQLVEMYHRYLSRDFSDLLKSKLTIKESETPSEKCQQTRQLVEYYHLYPSSSLRGFLLQCLKNRLRELHFYPPENNGNGYCKFKLSKGNAEECWEMKMTEAETKNLLGKVNESGATGDTCKLGCAVQ